MKIVLLSSSESVHTIRWANGLASKGIDVHLVSRHTLIKGLSSNVTYHQLKNNGKFSYLTNVILLRKIIYKVKPDLVHVHFISGYGTLALLSNIEFISSVWGSDIYDFPKKSFIHSWLIKKVLLRTKAITSTSHCMKVETLKYTKKDIKVIPFGVDLEKYQPVKECNKDSYKFTVGMIKVIDYKYGVDTFLSAINILINEKNIDNIDFVIGGDGPQLTAMKKLAKEYKIDEKIKFKGWIDNDQVPKELSALDLFVIPSRLDSESFGVVAVEAGAMQLPCIVTNVGGLPEVIDNNLTGLVIEKEDPIDLAEKIIYLKENYEVRNLLGINAREKCRKEYDWLKNTKDMIEFYKGNLL